MYKIFLLPLLFVVGCVHNESALNWTKPSFEKFVPSIAKVESVAPTTEAEPIDRKVESFAVEDLVINTNVVNITSEVVNITKAATVQEEQDPEPVKEQEPVKEEEEVQGIKYGNYNDMVQKYGQDGGEFYVLITAEWCGPCKMLKQKLTELNPNVEIVVFDYDTMPQEYRRAFFGDGPYLLPRFMKVKCLGNNKMRRYIWNYDNSFQSLRGFFNEF